MAIDYDLITADIQREGSIRVFLENTDFPGELRVIKMGVPVGYDGEEITEEVIADALETQYGITTKQEAWAYATPTGAKLQEFWDAWQAMQAFTFPPPSNAALVEHIENMTIVVLTNMENLYRAIS